MEPSKTTRILLAEDNPVNQKVTLRVLEKMGFNVTLVGSGRDVLTALNKADEAPYALILMDCQMPDIDGYEATRLIRTGTGVNSQTIPIIAMTANAVAGDREKCLQAGMNDYLAKPLEPSNLESVLKKWLKDFSKSTAAYAAESAPSSDHVVDLTVIENLREMLAEDESGSNSNEPDPVKELIELYLSTAPKSVQEIQTAFIASDWKKVSAVAHGLKSSSANLGVLRVSAICHRLENLNPDPATVPELVAALQTEFNLAVTELRAMV